MDKIKTNIPAEGYCVSRIGGREENQDTCGYADTPYGLLVVLCDGMGGGPAGKTASVLAVENIIKYVMNFLPGQNIKIDRKTILRSAIATADKVIKTSQQENKELEGMGTTVVALLINAESAIVAHVGDSRCYQFRFGKRKFRTEDHSFVADLVRKGQLTEEQARLSSQANIITRALSGRSDGTPFITELGYEKGDRFLLCTDGIWGAMPEKKLVKRLATGSNLAMIVERIASDVDEIGVRAGGGHDNLTLSLIKINNDSKYKEPMNRKCRNILVGLVAFSILCLIFGLYAQFSNSSVIVEKNRQIENLKENLSNGFSEKSIAKIKSLEDTIAKIKSKKAEDIDVVKERDRLNKDLNAILAEKDNLFQENAKLNQKIGELNAIIKNLQEKKINLDGKGNKKTVAKKQLVNKKECEQLKAILGQLDNLQKCRSNKKSSDIAESIKKSLISIYSRIKNTPAGPHVKKVISEVSKEITKNVELKGRTGQINILINEIEIAIDKL